MEAPESKLRHPTPESVFLADISTAFHLFPSMFPFFLPGEGLSENRSDQNQPRFHQSGFSQRGSISSWESGHCSCSSQTEVPGQGKWDQKPRKVLGMEQRALYRQSHVATITLWVGFNLKRNYCPLLSSIPSPPHNLGKATLESTPEQCRPGEGPGVHACCGEGSSSPGARARQGRLGEQ